MKVIILCAGYGTRLYPLTKDKPKALLQLGGVPIIERILERVDPVKEVDCVYVISNHRFVENFYYWRKEYLTDNKPKYRVEIFDDMTSTNEERLGAVGDIKFVVDNAKLNDDVIVVAGDNLITFDIDEFAAFGRDRRLAVAVKDIKDKKAASMYGVLSAGKSGQVTEFEEKPAQPKSTLISIGLYYFGKEFLPQIQTYISEGNTPDQPGFFLAWLFRKNPLFVYVVKGQWFDIGDIDSYSKANEMLGG